MLGSMIALTISAVTVSIIYYRRYGRVSINLSATLEQLLWVLPVVLFLVGFILLPLSPTDQSDELSYHLPYAQFYLDNQGLAVNESLRYPLHTQNLNLLYSMGLAFSGPLMTHLIHASLAVLTAFGIYGFCQHYSNSLTGFMAVIVFLGFQKTVQAMTNAYVDLGVPCFLFASIFSLLKWQESDDRRFFILSAVSLGIVMGIKYIGMLFPIPLGLLVLYHSRSVSTFLKYTAITTLFGIPWYLRSFLISGDPVHPFGGNIFGFYIWNADDLQRNLANLNQLGIDKTFLNLVTLPWHLFTEPEKFRLKEGLEPIVWSIFYITPFLFKFCSKQIRFLLIISWIYLFYWFFSSQSSRYMLAIYPLVSISICYMFALLYQWIIRYFFRGRDPFSQLKVSNVSRFFLVLACVFIAIHSISELNRYLEEIPITEDRQVKHLIRKSKGYELLQAANSHPDLSRSTLVQICLEGSRYFYDGNLIGDWFGRYPYSLFWEFNNDTNRNTLKQATVIRDILMDIGAVGIVIHLKCRDGIFPDSRRKDFENYFTLVKENRYGVLYLMN